MEYVGLFPCGNSPVYLIHVPLAHQVIQRQQGGAIKNLFVDLKRFLTFFQPFFFCHITTRSQTDILLSLQPVGLCSRIPIYYISSLIFCQFPGFHQHHVVDPYPQSVAKPSRNPAQPDFPICALHCHLSVAHHLDHSSNDFTSPGKSDSPNLFRFCLGFSSCQIPHLVMSWLENTSRYSGCFVKYSLQGAIKAFSSCATLFFKSWGCSLLSLKSFSSSS